jgi:hypothetical protein
MSAAGYSKVTRICSMKGSDLIQKRVQAQPLISVEKFQTEKWLM